MFYLLLPYVYPFPYIHTTLPVASLCLVYCITINYICIAHCIQIMNIHFSPVSAQPHTQSSRTVCHEGYREKPEQGHCRRISSTSSIFSVEAAAAAASQHSMKMKKNKKPPAQIALANFFQRTRTIARIVHLLQKEGGDWDSELLQEALQSEERQEPFDAQLLVTQVLKVDDLPCDISLRFFQWLKGQPPTIFEHNEYTYGVMLNALGRVGRLYEMEELL